MRPYADTNVTPDDRLMAMLAFLLGIVAGFVAPLVIYLSKREQSRFVAYHALQALLWQVAFGAVVGIIWVGCVVTMVASSGFGPAAGPPPLAFLGGIGFIMLASLGNLAAHIIYGIKANNGEWAAMPLVGGLAARWCGI